MEQEIYIELASLSINVNVISIMMHFTTCNCNLWTPNLILTCDLYLVAYCLITDNKDIAVINLKVIQR